MEGTNSYLIAGCSTYLFSRSKGNMTKMEASTYKVQINKW
jgi:hypothetical protein